MALVHGGRLRQAAQHSAIALDDWLDLSTGISPWSYPVASVPEACWRRLPEDDDGLEAVARQWADAPREAGCVCVAGSQPAIQALPYLRPPGRVAVVVPGYQEHAHCWQRAGHAVELLDADGIDADLTRFDVVVWIQPNNPTGEWRSLDTLKRWHRQLASNGGWLIIDEAFVEASDAPSLVAQTAAEGLIVLRSIGKFFGLAGLRGGFVFASATLCGTLAERLGPWAVNTPARWIMRQALADRDWQIMQAERLDRQSRHLDRVLEASGLRATGGTRLFRYVRHPDAVEVHERLKQQAILCRLFVEPAALRFGLPGTSEDLNRLESALQAVLSAMQKS